MRFWGNVEEHVPIDVWMEFEGTDQAKKTQQELA
jgi:hypothetical protein